MPLETGGKEGAKCERVVVVEFERGKVGEEENPAPRGIVTSFNQVIP
jgi:hypothetical protein